MKLREKDLEDLLFYHPYLIDEVFANLAPRQIRRQAGRGVHRSDLLFDLPDGLCIVELKITRLTASDVNQLARYCGAWSKTERLATFHLLIGKRPLDEAGILQTISAGKFKIKLCYLGIDLPTQLVFDENARRYRGWQLSDSAGNMLELHL